MIIKLDCRETGLISAVKNYIAERDLQNIKVETCNLDVGDIIILDDRNVDIEPQENVIIERKSIKDLAASIRDGRYQEQSFRLSNDPIPNHNIMYLMNIMMYCDILRCYALCFVNYHIICIVLYHVCVASRNITKWH